jgi:hypothetical protein
MDTLASTQLTIPVLQVVLMLALSTGSLIIGRIKLALLINYCFALYWGYIANMDLFSAGGATTFNNYTFTYFGFGIVIVLLAMIGLVAKR